MHAQYDSLYDSLYDGEREWHFGHRVALAPCSRPTNLTSTFEIPEIFPAAHVSFCFWQAPCTHFNQEGCAELYNPCLNATSPQAAMPFCDPTQSLPARAADMVRA